MNQTPPLDPGVDAYPERAANAAPASSPRSPLRPSPPGIASVLSLILPGLGQAWLGAARRGLLIALPLVIGALLLIGAALFDRRALIAALLEPTVLVVIFGLNLAFAAYHLLAIDDAYRVGARRSPVRGRWSRLRSPLSQGGNRLLGRDELCGCAPASR